MRRGIPIDDLSATQVSVITDRGHTQSLGDLNALLTS